MIAIARAWFSGRKATGIACSISRPSTYSGNCGPGTFVTIRLNSRVEKLSREAWARIVGGAKFWAPAITSAPSACFDSFSPSIALLTQRRPDDLADSLDSFSGFRDGALGMRQGVHGALGEGEAGTHRTGQPGGDEVGRAGFGVWLPGAAGVRDRRRIRRDVEEHSGEV